MGVRGRINIYMYMVTVCGIASRSVMLSHSLFYHFSSDPGKTNESKLKIGNIYGIHEDEKQRQDSELYVTKVFLTLD